MRATGIEYESIGLLRTDNNVFQRSTNSQIQLHILLPANNYVVMTQCACVNYGISGNGIILL